LPQGLVLRESLEIFSPSNFVLYILCLDNECYDILSEYNFSNVVPIRLDEIEGTDPLLLEAKASRSRIEYIFTLTPCLIWYVLRSYENVDFVSYVDADIKFFFSPEVIFEEISEKSVFIIPHNFSERNQHLIKYGKYNVGLVGVRNDPNGNNCVAWWRKKCIEWCYDRLDGNRFADQKYLDDWPTLFAGVVVSKNPGLNLAAFNVDNFVLSMSQGGFMISGKRLIFYHYHDLKQLNTFLWKLNVVTLKEEQKTVIKLIYEQIISRLKFFQIQFTSKNLIQPRHSTKAMNLLREFQRNTILFHIRHISFFVDLRKLVSGIFRIRNLFR